MVSGLTHRLQAMTCAALLVAGLAERSLAQSQHGDTGAKPATGGVSARPTDSLTPQTALGIALASHPDLRVAMANLAAARVDSAFAGLPAFNPQLELNVARGGSSLLSGSEGTFDLGVSQELELWGKRAARQSAATARAQVSEAELRAAWQDIESDVRARFERVLFLQDRLGIANELTGLDGLVVRASQARVRDGSITPLTGRLTELDLLRLEAQGRRTRSDLHQALLALGLAMGQALPDTIRLQGELHADSLTAPVDSVVAMALRTRATGEVLHRQLAARQAELRQAELDGRPNLTLGVGLTRDRRSFSHDDFSGDPTIVGGIAGATSTDDLWTARISAPLPLWQRNQAGRARAAAEIGRSEAELVRYRLQTKMEVLAATRRFEDSAGLYGLYLERSNRVRADLVLIREAYTDGRIPLDSYLTQKGRLVDTLLGQLEAGEAYWQARGQLEAAVGLDLAHLNAGGAR